MEQLQGLLWLPRIPARINPGFTGAGHICKPKEASNRKYSSARKPHAAFEVAGVGNGKMTRLRGTLTRKGRIHLFINVSINKMTNKLLMHIILLSRSGKIALEEKRGNHDA
jgi:hypothetical protein